MKYIEATRFLMNSVNTPIVDVRSPEEFNLGHITNAHNIPLFNNEERALIGTLYNRSGPTSAIEMGYEIANPKKKLLIQDALSIAIENKLLVHCWRGGMRSEKTALLFESAGIECGILIGGYKAYRNQILEDFSKLDHLIVLHGPTGSGKTEILNELKKMGEQVIDLESIANHRGSAFGNILMGDQPTTMQFQNNIHRLLSTFNPSKRIWIEGESINIGKVVLPSTLWELMNRSRVIKIDLPVMLRVHRIVNEYGKFPKYLLIDSANKLMKRFGSDKLKEVIRLIECEQLEEAVKSLLEYYDKKYKGIDKYLKGNILSVYSETINAFSNAEIILNKIRE